MRESERDPAEVQAARERAEEKYSADGANGAEIVEALKRLELAECDRGHDLEKPFDCLHERATVAEVISEAQRRATEYDLEEHELAHLLGAALVSWRGRKARASEVPYLGAGWAVNIATIAIQAVSPKSPVWWYLDLIDRQLEGGQLRLFGPVAADSMP